MGKAITRAGAPGTRRLNEAELDRLAPQLIIVRPGQRFGDFRIEYFGSDLERVSGDLTGTSFADLLHIGHMRSCLAGYRNVCDTRLPELLRNQPIAGTPNLRYTRLLLPLFTGDRVTRIIGAVSLLEQAPALDRGAPQARIY
ncbi:hypothetical protein QNA08_05490 [Chelatococcus sp. SYSU_G07232]|uniref:PAS domain-containing protein n=1 Tax=Chelatococcus albus TaxID=3047466 RepID=A0ABT7AE79_9HYPH|nr:hypothetical protein [Chelatococcus sp. SYSU_G07232]MDJ1157683.1 hypothetical protein [Chelatococcus sp. SYSU_G07232]